MSKSVAPYISICSDAGPGKHIGLEESMTLRLLTLNTGTLLVVRHYCSQFDHSGRNEGLESSELLYALPRPTLPLAEGKRAGGFDLVLG